MHCFASQYLRNIADNSLIFFLHTIQMCCCLSYVFIDQVKEMMESSLGKKGYSFLFRFKDNIIIRTKTRSEAETLREHLLVACYSSMLSLFSFSTHLPRSGSTHIKWHSHIYHQSGKCHTALLTIQFHRSIFGIEVPSSQITFVYVKLQNQPAALLMTS